MTPLASQVAKSWLYAENDSAKSIARFGTAIRPARSRDITPLDYFLRGYIAATSRLRPKNRKSTLLASFIGRRSAGLNAPRKIGSSERAAFVAVTADV